MKPVPKKTSSKDPVANPSRVNEDVEPVAAVNAAPTWLFPVFAVLFFWCLMYLNESGGGFDPQVYAPYASRKEVEALQPVEAGDKMFLLGKDVYGRTCFGCHMANGQGIPNQNPPLVGSEWVLLQSPARMINIVLHGLTGPISVKGADYNGTMVPWKDNLSDEEIAAVVTYVRSEWGNKAPAATADQVKKYRAETASKTDNMTVPELQKLPETE